MKIPISIEDIINLPMDEFNERLSKYDLTEAQLSLIRDIRRRGKNKVSLIPSGFCQAWMEHSRPNGLLAQVAAQNCRKRKLDQIMSLAEEVKQLQTKRERLTQDRDFLSSQRHRLGEQYSLLYRHVFQVRHCILRSPFAPWCFNANIRAERPSAV
ncbi:unnamed protein product [Darwinula stevensoni]|uniref:Basic leucine zipper domain-containing protein n=1 Tax=Darwinula stevensoni TaxID=69355 RepID=A0A7R8XGW9_9CRUS|nr:unnamed protein product [Darwinula stevensoni]CAG0891904.1 unnamed protein product [Darwinula stevensoni]